MILRATPNVFTIAIEKYCYEISHIRAMRQKCKEKPTPQELDARFMKIIFDSAAEISNDLHISPGNDKEAFIVISGNCKFAIMPRG